MKLLATFIIGLTALCSTASAGTMTDNRDGHVYQTVQIDNQVWMSENMAIEIKGSYPTNGGDNEVKEFGRLYSWKAAKMACPRGWHLPSKQEFEHLLKNVCGINSEGEINKLGCKDKLNSSEFRALPAGYRSTDGHFYFGANANFWSSTARGGAKAYYLYVTSTYSKVHINRRHNALSVRCIKD